VPGGWGEAGNISIDSVFTFLAHSRLFANAFAGIGGNVRIFSPEGALFDTESFVAASSTIGIAQAVPLDALSGAVTLMPQAFVHVAALLPARCAARAQDGRYSSLVLGGRSGLPLDPSGVLSSPLALDERLAADPAITTAPPPRQPPVKFALLANQEKVLPRLAGDCAH
jgi:hypothetical protein